MKFTITKSIILLFSFIVFVFSANAEEIEKMQVIGSHIKKTQEGASPVLIIDRKQLELSGYNSVSDVLRDLPTASSGGRREASLSDGSTGTSLRGMGSSDILMLLNGRRLSPIGGGSSFDLAILPISAIDKIEVLKDGASAIYGSDAIGGVINIITKKDFVGTQINVQTSLTQRKDENTLSGFASFVDFNNWNDKKNSWDQKGDKISIDATHGGSIQNINYLVSGQLKLNTNMYLRDRDFGPPSKEHYSSYGNPGSWSEDGSEWKPDTNCPKERIRGGLCSFDYGPYMQFMPQIAQGSLFTTADTTINDSSIFVTALYTFTNYKSVLAPPPHHLVTPSRKNEIGVKNKDFRIPPATAANWGLSTKGPIELKYRLVKEKGSGVRRTNININYYQVSSGINVPLLDTLEFDGYINISGFRSLSTGTAGWVNLEKLLKLANKTPTQFNPFLPDNKKSDIATAVYKPIQITNSNLFTAEPQLVGEIFSTLDHTMSFAIGNLTAWQNYTQSNDDITAQGKQWGGGSSSSGNGNRWYSSVYSELSLLSFEKVDLQLATRTDYFNDFGFAKQTIPFTDIIVPVSPRVAVSVKPVDAVQLRASWSLGFKAPTLAAINLKELIDHPHSLDYTLCEKPDPTIPNCTITQFLTKTKGNKNLKPELSQSFNVGIIFEPVNNLFFSVDYYKTTQSNIISTPSLRDVLLYEKEFKPENLKDLSAKVNRDKKGLIKNIELQAINQATSKVQGLDFELGFLVPLVNAWDMKVKIDHSYLIYGENKASKKSQPLIPVPYSNSFVEKLFTCDNLFAFSKCKSEPKKIKDYATLYGVPRWRNNVTFNFINKDLGHSVRAVVQNIPSQNKDWESAEKINYYWQLDLAGSIKVNKKTNLTLGVKNVLGAKRPSNNLSYGESGYINASLYTIRGRTIDAKLTYNF